VHLFFSQNVDAALLPLLSDETNYQILSFHEAIKTKKVLKIMKKLQIRAASPQELQKYYRKETKENVILVSPLAIYVKEEWIGIIKTVTVIYENEMFLSHFRGSKWPPSNSVCRNTRVKF
jgi:hypothetical protein